MAQPQLKPVVIINTFKHVSTFLNGVLSIILVTFLLQEVVSYVELKVSKMNILRLLLPRATGVFTLLKKKVTLRLGLLCQHTEHCHTTGNCPKDCVRAK